MADGRTPLWSSSTIRPVRVKVLPLPAPAEMTSMLRVEEGRCTIDWVILGGEDRVFGGKRGGNLAKTSVLR